MKKHKKQNLFLQFGACVKEMLCHVRPSRDDGNEMEQGTVEGYD